VYPSYADEAYRIHFLVMNWGDESFDTKNFKSWKIWKITIYPANMLVTSPDVLQMQSGNQQDLVKQVDYFRK
jgi:excinuclease ABC subunit B